MDKNLKCACIVMVIYAALCVCMAALPIEAAEIAPVYQDGTLTCQLNSPAELAPPNIVITSNITGFAEYIIHENDMSWNSKLQTRGSSAMSTAAYANGGSNYLNVQTKSTNTRSNSLTSSNHLEHEGAGAMYTSDSLAIQNYHTNATWMNGNTSYPYSESYEAEANHFGDDGVLATQQNSSNNPISDYEPTSATLTTHVSGFDIDPTTGYYEDIKMGDSVMRQRYNAEISAGSLTDTQSIGYNEILIKGGNRSFDVEFALKSRKQTYADTIYPFNATKNTSIDPNLTAMNNLTNLTEDLS